MSLFQEIEGLRGENLSSAILAHILLRSPELRDRLIHLISKKSPVGPIYSRYHFSVRREVPIRIGESDDETGSPGGRLDLLIETDNAIIGIENKFFAPFQQDQPKKYLEPLEVYADALGKLHNTSHQAFLVIMAPALRATEINDRLKEQGINRQAVLVTWQEVLNNIRPTADASTLDRFLLRELDQYARTQLGELLELERIVPHLFRDWEPRGTAHHRQFMDSVIWPLLHESVKSGNGYSHSSGKNFYGWYLFPGGLHPDDNARESIRIWLGFVRFNESPPELMLTIQPRNRSRELIKNLKYKHSTDWSNSDCYTVAADPIENGDTLQAWAKALEPVNELLGRLAGNGGAE